MSQETKRKKVVIVGGGIAGLAAAFRLKQLCIGAPVEITLLEAGERFGGAIKTVSADECMLELGPDNVLTAKPWAVNLMKELGLEDQIIDTDSGNRRAFVANAETLLPMPEGFRLIAPASISALAASPCLTFAGKLRAAIEPLIPRHPAMASGKLPDDYDESLSSFVTRRLGKEALDRLAQPLFSGIYTACPDTLSVRATMPQFLEFEADHGSVIRGLKSKSGKIKHGSADGESVRYSLFVSLKNGMESLINSLITHLNGVNLQTNKPVSRLEYSESSKHWKLGFSDGSSFAADAVILSLPAGPAAKLLSASCPKASELLSTINYASSAVINFIVERANVMHALDGFGFVVPAALGKNILAGSFSSVKFKGRAPKDRVILRAFMGGALFAHQMELSDSEMRELAFEDLSHYLSIKSPARGLPYREAIVTRWNDSMPQYAVGHKQLVKQIKTEIDAVPGLFICGAAYDGVGIPDCIRNADRAAQKLFDTHLSPASK